MRKTLVVLVAVMTVGMTIPAFAELQNVKVGGSLRIRGNWYSEEVVSVFDDDFSEDALYVEQRTRINVSADFTDDVHAFIELDHYNNWGEEFRGLDSDGVLTGVDGLSTSGNNYDFDSRAIPSISSDGSVSLYQAYVEMKDAWGAPIDIKIGRSEMVHGDEFLVGNNDTSSTFRGLSFDGVWLKYNNDNFNVTGFWTRVFQDFSPLDSSGDANFSGIYGSYTGMENMTIDAFYYFYHGASIPSVNGLAEAQALHTFGARFAGNASQFDWAANAAYQIGDTGAEDGTGDSIDVNEFAVQATAGYTFDVNMQPRIFINGGYYGGGDEDGEEGAFNRLFSDHEYSEFIDGTELTNFWYVGGGVSAQVTEAIGLTGVVNWFNSIEDFEDSGLSSDSDLGLEVALYAKYDYSEDLYFQAGYAHFFAGDAVEDGAYVNNPNGFSGSPTLGGFGSDDDVDYVFLETGISF